MKLLLASLLLTSLACLLPAQTAVYPGAIATDGHMGVAVENTFTTLTAAMGVGDTIMYVASGANFVPNTIATMGGAGGEQILVCGVSGNNISIGKSTCPNVDGRGFAGTTAAIHAGGAVVGLYQNSWYPNADRVEIEALEATLGINLANMNWGAIHGTRQGSATVPQMAGTNSGVAGSTLCDDGSGDATTTGCAALLPASLLWANLGGTKQGNTNVPQMAGTNSGVAGATHCNDIYGNATTSGCVAAGTVLPTPTGPYQFARSDAYWASTPWHVPTTIPLTNVVDFRIWRATPRRLARGRAEHHHHDPRPLRGERHRPAPLHERHRRRGGGGKLPDRGRHGRGRPGLGADYH